MTYSEEVAIVVGYQLWLANRKFERGVYGLRPWDVFDRIMDDLVSLDPTAVPWSEERKDFKRKSLVF